MIIGDPYKFAFIIDIVDKWSDSHFLNGIFYYSINGRIIPEISEYLLNTTLNSDVYILTNDDLLKFSEPIHNPELFNLELSEVLERLYSSLRTDDLEGCYYKYSTMTMEDHGYYVFCIRSHEKIRFIAGKNELKSDTYIINPLDEVIIDKEIFDQYSQKFLNYCDLLFSKKE